MTLRLRKLTEEECRTIEPPVDARNTPVGKLIGKIFFLLPDGSVCLVLASIAKNWPRLAWNIL